MNNEPQLNAMVKIEELHHSIQNNRVIRDKIFQISWILCHAREWDFTIDFKNPPASCSRCYCSTWCSPHSARWWMRPRTQQNSVSGMAVAHDGCY
ncbi:hypothetical protein MESS2_1030171 [Mesorhizobium metallidurans STM 2683]|uniref:Uncharacterized protein n=1 Tax=Mesorhizobium metallidurans STM 2683 TaxID=1297569 RepID=M5EF64_9HYPH|nr:hypothetical protein MESS2_1030171 [Mesorhizobium metallidurans STM 2683]